MPEPKLPGGLERRPDGSEPTTQMSVTGKDAEGLIHGHFVPEMSGFQCQVQHPTKTGQPATTELGMLGLGLVMTPLGPVHALSITHPDGTGLGAILSAQDLMQLLSLVMEQAHLGVDVTVPGAEAN